MPVLTAVGQEWPLGSGISGQKHLPGGGRLQVHSLASGITFPENGIGIVEKKSSFPEVLLCSAEIEGG